jgi:hypothetical protein
MNAPTPLQPWDAHNRRLHAHIHPTDWVKPPLASRYNPVVIGGQTLRFEKAAIATGARTAAPPIAGRADVPDPTNETLCSPPAGRVGKNRQIRPRRRYRS